MFHLFSSFFFAAPTSAPATQEIAAHWLQGRTWQVAAWLVACVFFLVWGVSVWLFWSRRDIRGNNPFYIIFRQAFLQFRTPLILLSLGATWITAAGFIAGAQISMILFAGLSTATIAIFSLLAWKLWPQKGVSGNLFDLLPLPGVQWPHYENEQDRLARVWVQERVRQTKLHPPAFRGEHFGMIVLQTAEELADIYKKPTILSVQTEALLQGIERTAADMKILCNHLPLADRLTLAEFEKEIQTAAKEGKRLYLFLLLILSVVNPGNLLRVFLLLLKARSPWEHVLRDLESWVYANYTERLGYHMTLIYSGRKPPPIEDLEALIQKNETEQEREARNKKLGTLAFLSLFGSGLYLLLQFASATAFFGLPFVMLSLPILGALAYSAWQLRAAHRWRKFWDALRPQWPLEPPPLTEKDRRAFDQADLVLLKKAPLPAIKDMKETRQLPAHYGRIVWDLWEACFSAYADPKDPVKLRATRAFYLPQGFAGIEALAHDLRRWYKSEAFFARSLRVMENFGWDLGFLYKYLEQRSQQKADESALSTQAPQIASDTTKPLPSSSSSDDLPAKSEISDVSPTDHKAPETPSFWNNVWQGVKSASRVVGDFAKDLAIKEAHQRFLRLVRHDLVVRLVDIYGARFPASTFAQAPRDPQATPLLTTSLPTDETDTIVDAIVEPNDTSAKTTDTPTPSSDEKASTQTTTPTQTTTHPNHRTTETTTPTQTTRTTETSDKTTSETKISDTTTAKSKTPDTTVVESKTPDTTTVESKNARYDDRSQTNRPKRP